MTEKHFIITLSEGVVIKETSGTITRNSNSSQWIDVALDGWLLNENDLLYIELKHYDPDTELTTRVGPLPLLYNNALKRYVTLAPPEFVALAGQWEYSIELRFNVAEAVNGKTTTTVTTVTDSNGTVLSTIVTGQGHDDEIFYDSITSSIKTLTVIDTVINPSTGNIIKETELLAAARTVTQNAATAQEAANQAVTAKNEAQQAKANAELAQTAAEQAKKEAERFSQAAATSAQTAAEQADKAKIEAVSARQAQTYAEQAKSEIKATATATEKYIDKFIGQAFMRVQGEKLIINPIKQSASVQGEKLIINLSRGANQ